MEKKINLLDLNPSEIEELVINNGEKKFRGKQIFEWLYKNIDSIDEMTNISKDFKHKLQTSVEIKRSKIVRRIKSKNDETIKFLIELYDNNVIECVLMKYNHGYTACLSTQVGCKMGCKFCASSELGFDRNLSSGEMIDQILTIQKSEDIRISNIVLMGIGEPLDNYENVVKFLKMINISNGLNIGLRHVSLSTCGVVPKIYELMKEKFGLTLSVSLHASNNDTRNMIMPINKKYPIEMLIEACYKYVKETGRRITFEYAIIDGVNDNQNEAQELAILIKNILCHVNLIPVNKVPDSKYTKSTNSKIQKFKNVLEGRGINVTIRRELGTDIEAACGQLRRGHES